MGTEGTVYIKKTGVSPNPAGRAGTQREKANNNNYYTYIALTFLFIYFSISSVALFTLYAVSVRFTICAQSIKI